MPEGITSLLEAEKRLLITRRGTVAKGTPWLTSSPIEHGGHFIQIVEWAREGSHEAEVDKFLEEQEQHCQRLEKANPLLRQRWKRENKKRKKLPVPKQALDETDGVLREILNKPKGF